MPILMIILALLLAVTGCEKITSTPIKNQSKVHAQVAQIEQVAEYIRQPEKYLERKHKVVVLGNSPLAEAKIILLPEVHDDPETLLTQLLLLAQQKQKPGNKIFLSESINAFKKSKWELLSQKTLDIIAANQNAGPYSPHHFEQYLSLLATELNENGTIIKTPSGLWSLATFSNDPTNSWGWDLKNNASLTARNRQMVQSIAHALKENDRVILTMGALHVPELEYLVSLKLLCQGHNIKNMDAFFSFVADQHKTFPELPYGIGATEPIYNFLVQQKYAVAFNENLYNKIEKAVHSNGWCLNVNASAQL